VWRLVADEFDELSGYNFSTLVDKGRSAKSIPIMAHQNLSQLIKESDDTLYKSVTSSPIKVTLRVSSADAQEISWVREPDLRDNLSLQSRFSATVTLADGLPGLVDAGQSVPIHLDPLGEAD